MKHSMIFMLMLLYVVSVNAQDVLIDKGGVAHFYSEAPVENIEATNEKAIGAYNPKDGSVAVTMFMKDFHFEKSLMEEHFNENYIESDKYPKATFKGKLDSKGLDLSKPGTYMQTVGGELTIHGITKKLRTEVEFVVSKEEVQVNTLFKVALEDHDIEIPKIVIMNIAEVVDVDAHFNFSLK